MKIKFITLETSPDPLEKNCVQSGRMNNIDIEVLGRGYEWQGFVTKVHILKDYISNIKEKYVCFTDARDVIYLGNNEQIWNTYKKHYLDKLVLNAEINCFPDTCKVENPAKPVKYTNNRNQHLKRHLLPEIQNLWLPNP